MNEFKPCIDKWSQDQCSQRSEATTETALILMPPHLLVKLL